MLSVTSLSLGSRASMVIRVPTPTQTQHSGASAFSLGKGSTSRRSSHCSPLGFLSFGNSNSCTTLSSSFKTAVAAVDSDQVSSSNPADKVSSTVTHCASCLSLFTYQLGESQFLIYLINFFRRS